MQIKNKVFLKDVDVFIVDGEYCRPSKQFGYVDVSQIELIGLMTICLLNEGFMIDKTPMGSVCYIVYDRATYKEIANSASLYDCLVEAINKLGADNAN
jgi:hypothetical protein